MREKIESLKSDNPNYCNINKNSEDCICQNGYMKLKKYIGEGEDGTFTCIPTPCSQVFGHSTLGDDDSVIEINYELCIDAVNREKVSLCDIIDYVQGQDLCRFAYVERTNDIEQCRNIKDKYLKNECYN